MTTSFIRHTHNLTDTSSLFFLLQVRHGVSNFLHEIGKTKVLTKEEEILLATNVQDHSKVARACLYFKKEEGREPTDAELCSLFNMVGVRSASQFHSLRGFADNNSHGFRKLVRLSC